jgi:hypothetical protein
MVPLALELGCVNEQPHFGLGGERGGLFFDMEWSEFLMSRGFLDELLFSVPWNP